MTKKKKANKSIKQALCEKDVQQSFVKNMKKGKERNGSKNQAENSDLLESADDFNNLRKSILKEFSVLRKSDGLITGTNEVLRLLEKERLIAIFVSKNNGISKVVRGSFCKLCKQSGVELICLDDKERDSFGPEFPKSITYGIKKEPFTSLGNLKRLLLEFSLIRNKKRKDDINVDEDNKAVFFTDISLNEMKLPSTEEATNQELVHTSTFYHTHETHTSKKSNANETGFLSLNKFSTDEKETAFLDYDSIACSGVLSIK